MTTISTMKMLGFSAALAAGWLLHGADRAHAAGVTCGPETEGFYTPPALAGEPRPGTLLRCESVDAHSAAELSGYAVWRSTSPDAATPFGVHHYRILYVSEGPDGKRVPVSATVYLPTGAGGTCDAKLGAPIAAVQHGTTGMADSCAPSKRTEWLGYMALPLVGRGMAVVATDYEGLGTPGIHPYLDGVTEGKAVLDGVRALSQLPDAACVGHEVLFVGHSQGGQATLFAAQLAATYGMGAGMHSAGAVAWAPAFGSPAFSKGEKISIPGSIPTTGSTIFFLMYLWSTSQIHGSPAPSAWLTPEAQTELPKLLESECVQALMSDLPSKFPTLGSIFTPAMLADANAEPWVSYSLADVPGQVHTDVPTLIVQGREDKLVSAAGSRCLADRMAGLHSPVETCALDGGHLEIVGKSWKSILPWITAVTHGQKPPALPAECTSTPLPDCK